MPPRNPLQDVHNDSIDLTCTEIMPLPHELAPPVLLEGPVAVPGLQGLPELHFPTLDALFALGGFAPPLHASVETTCWCLDQCVGPVCLVRFMQPARKRKARSPSPRVYFPEDDHWVQTFTLWHPGDFEKTIVEMDSNRPLHAIFHQLCADLRIDRKTIRFVWKRNRRRGGVQDVVLHDTTAPWDVGMKEDTDETVECEYV